MIDYEKLQNDHKLIMDIVKEFTVIDLRQETEELINTLYDMISECIDADVVFQPVDEQAYDPDASDPAEENMAWTLGHVIVHLTASAEEKAALAAELARGVLLHGRSRREVPWQDVTTIKQCMDRLAESRRMCLASLDMWPDQPYLDNKKIPWTGMPRMDARGFYLLGLIHASEHFEQVADIVRQAKEARQ